MNKLIKTSDIFILLSAALSMAVSIYFWFNGYKEEGVFIGLWVPSLLGFGNYLKNLVIQYKIERKENEKCISHWNLCHFSVHNRIRHYYKRISQSEWKRQWAEKVITNLIFIIGVIVFITFFTGIFMLGKDEKIEAKNSRYNSHLDTNDYDGMGDFSRFGNSRKK